MSGGELHHESGVSAFDGSPYVLLTWGHESGQLDVDEAVQLGADIIRCAQAAQHDAAIAAEMKEAMELPQDIVARFISRLRDRLHPERLEPPGG